MCSSKVISNGLPLLHHDPPLLQSKVVSHSLFPLSHGLPVNSKVMGDSLPLLHRGRPRPSNVVSHGLPLLSYSPNELLLSPPTHQLQPSQPVQYLPEVDNFSDAEQSLTHLNNLHYNDDPYEAQNYVSGDLVLGVRRLKL